MTNYNSNGKEILLYDPDEYLILKEWLSLFNSDAAMNTEYLLAEAKKIHKELYSFLGSKEFLKNWNKILDNCKTEKQLIYQRKNWFDAFKTLKLIHHLRDTTFPMLNIIEGVEKLLKQVDHPFISISNYQMNEVDIRQHYLSELKKLEYSHVENSLTNISISSLV
jgi:hypothetical protein